MEKQIFVYCHICHRRAMVTRGPWITYLTPDQLERKKTQAAHFGLNIEKKTCLKCEVPK